MNLLAASLCCISFVYADSSTQTSSTTPSAFPINRQLDKQQHPNKYQVNSRIHKQWVEVQEAAKSGKISKEEAEKLSALLKGLYRKEVSFFAQNHVKEITTEQQAELNKSLDKTSQYLVADGLE